MTESSNTNTEPDPVAEAREAWIVTQEAADEACDIARSAARRLSRAVTAPRPERIDELAANAKAASTAWGEAIASEDAAYKAYVAAKVARS